MKNRGGGCLLLTRFPMRESVLRSVARFVRPGWAYGAIEGSLFRLSASRMALRVEGPLRGSNGIPSRACPQQRRPPQKAAATYGGEWKTTRRGGAWWGGSWPDRRLPWSWGRPRGRREIGGMEFLFLISRWGGVRAC